MIAGVLFMLGGKGLSVLLVWTKTPASTDVAQTDEEAHAKFEFQAFGFSDRLDHGWVGQGAS